MHCVISSLRKLGLTETSLKDIVCICEFLYEMLCWMLIYVHYTVIIRLLSCYSINVNCANISFTSRLHFQFKLTPLSLVLNCDHLPTDVIDGQQFYYERQRIILKRQFHNCSSHQKLVTERGTRWYNRPSYSSCCCCFNGSIASRPLKSRWCNSFDLSKAGWASLIYNI